MYDIGDEMVDDGTEMLRKWKGANVMTCYAILRTSHRSFIKDHSVNLNVNSQFSV